MPIVRSTESTPFEMHGSRFSSYVAPSRGSTQLCAWRLDVPADLKGFAHRPSREEVLLVLDGELRITLDGISPKLYQGDVALVAANSELTVDGGPQGTSVWITSTPGLEAITSDGSRVTAPWCR